MTALAIYSQAGDNVLQGIDASFCNDVTKEIWSFGLLPRGWDFGMGDPISLEMIRKALEIHDVGLELGLITEATPEVDGGITLTFVHEEDAIDIRIHPDYTYTVTHERGIGSDFAKIAQERGVHKSTALSYVYRLTEQKVEYISCKSSEYLAPRNSAEVKGDSGLDLVSIITDAVSPLWKPNVSANKEMQYAVI